MDKTYESKKYEKNIYLSWEKNNFFKPKNNENNNIFSIILPPPNVTGVLHLGHAAMIAIEDIIVRFKRMNSFEVLWLPGVDHAAIATQNVVEKKLKLENKSIKDLTRDEFIKECYNWTEKYHDQIVSQIKTMGGSLDWSRERFTMDEHSSKAVYEFFERMYNDELIYKGARMVNWCPRCMSTLSDDEVEHKNIKGNFYYIKYKIKDSEDFLEIATTRPETMFGDTAIAVSPKDDRYKDFIGKTAILPILERELKIIADERVSLDIGTGALKITPAHDPLDYEIGKKHNLEFINIFDKNGNLNENTGKDFNGLGKKEARDKIIKLLQKNGDLLKTEEIEHSVGTCYRCSSLIEPSISEQWFIDVNKKIQNRNNKSLKELMKEAIENKEIEIIPKRFEKNYFMWIDNLKDWCISRQVFWGHRLPVYYCLDCGEIIVSQEKVKECKLCNSKNIKQDNDTLDTWFSSALWPFSTMGWPDNDRGLDFEKFFPNTLLETGYDILFFWVARMILSSKYLFGIAPFKSVYLHGLVCDKNGKKMSKSKGNGIDPIDMVEKYGADAVRMSLVSGTTPGNNINIYEEKIEGYRNFINKLWNIFRFIYDFKETFSDIKISELEKLENTYDIENIESLADKWIITKLNNVISETTKKINNYKFGEASDILYEFIWKDFASWYIEIYKLDNYLNNKEVLRYVTVNILKLLHPFSPFITENLWQNIFNNYLISSSWPSLNKNIYKNSEKEFDILKNIISSIRNIKNNIKINKKLNILFLENKNINIVKNNLEIIKNLSGLEKIEFVKDGPKNTVQYIKIVSLNFEMFLEIDISNIEKINKDKEKEIKIIKNSIKNIENKLNNKNFILKAPEEIINKEKEKYNYLNKKLNKILN